MIVSNSSPIIFAAKLGILPLLRKLYGTILIPEEVYSEVVVKGKEIGAAEVIEIEKAIMDKHMHVTRVRNLPSKYLVHLHHGEQKAILLCRQEKINHILLDDREAIILCSTLGITTIRTTRVLLELLRKKLISREYFEDLLAVLSNQGYFMTAEVYDALRKAGKV